MNTTHKTAELAMALALADQLGPQVNQGRLKGLLKRLETAVMAEFRHTRKLSKRESREANAIVMRFAKLSGWEGKPRHIATKVNFLLALYEDRPWAKRIIPILEEIYFYFERANDAPAASLWSGALAVEKWERAKEAA